MAIPTILDNDDRLTSQLNRLAAISQMLLLAEREIQMAMSVHPSRRQAQLLLEADRLMGEAVTAVGHAGLALRGLEQKRSGK